MPAWRAGTAEQVADAMQNFIGEMYNQEIPPPTNHARQIRSMDAAGRRWLYCTDHIQMCYDVTYDGVAIERLSPGTRGIVLLLLYLVIDKHDSKPLIIDQPEENLDPKSVFDELVPHFREARKSADGHHRDS